MKTHHTIKFLTLVLLAVMLSLPLAALALAGPAQNTASAQDAAPNTTANTSASPIKAPQSATLGTINVKATKELIKTLQVVKVALKTPYSNDRNAVVCSIQVGRATEATLDCGSNSFYMDRRDACQLSATGGSGMVRGVSCDQTDNVSFKWGDRNQFHN